MRTPTACLEMLELELFGNHLILFGTEVFVIKEFRHICAKSGQSHQHPTFARGSARPTHWLDHRIREGDKCLEAGTDFDRSPGVAYTAVGRCSNE